MLTNELIKALFAVLFDLFVNTIEMIEMHKLNA